MKYEVLLQRGEEFLTDEFNTTTLKDHEAIAKTLKQLYEGSDVEVLGVVLIAQTPMKLL